MFVKRIFMNHPVNYRFFDPNHRRAQLAVIGLGIAALGSVMAGIALLDAVGATQQAASNPRLVRLESPFITQQLEIIASFQLLVYVITGLLFLLWIYHAYANHMALRPDRAEYSPDWAVWGFLIPIVNLFRPYQVIDEMWGAAANPIDSAPSDRPGRTSRRIVLAWWITFLTPQFLNRLGGGWSVRVYISATFTPLLIGLLSEALLIVSAVLAIHIVQTIDLNQELTARRLSPQTTWPDLPRWRPWLYLIPLGITVIAATFIWKERPALDLNEVADVMPTPIPTLRPSRSGTWPPTKSVTDTPIPTLRPIVYNTLDATRASMATPTKSPTATPTPRPTLSLAARDGLQYYKDGEYELALVQFNQALRYGPQDARLYYYRGLTNRALNDSAQALKDFDQAIKLDSKYVAAYVDRGWLHVDDDNYGKAQADFDWAIALDDEDAPAYAGRSYTRYLLKDHKPALADANKAVDLDDTYAEGFFVRGLIYHAVGEFEKAIGDFTTALDLDEHWPEAHYRRGLAHVALEENTAAHADFDRAIELDPNYIAPYFDRGILFYDLAKYPEALDDLNRVVKEIPDEGAAYFWRGAIHAKLGHSQQAIADLERALELSIEADIRRAANDLLKELKGERRPTS